VSKDPDYPVALLNLALIEDLRAEYGSAADHVRRACVPASGGRAEISRDLCQDAQAIIAAHTAGKTLPARLHATGTHAENSGPAITGLPEPAAVRFASENNEPIAIPPSSSFERPFTIESKVTASFTALRLRIGTEKLLVVDGTVDAEELPESLERLKQAPDVTRQTAFGLVEFYSRSQLFVFRNRAAHIVRWMRYAWAE
jgi:hypothetical protein